MASAITFTGLGSGLDTASIVTQLMGIEAAPQNRLKNTLATQQTKVSALQQLNTSMAALKTSADSFSSGSMWSKLTATSSSSAISISASSSAATSSVSVSVAQVATAASNTYTNSAKLSDVVTAASSLDITLSDGTTQSVSLADGKLSTVLSSLNGLKNASGTPLLNATAINDGTGNYRLVVNQVATGAGSLTITEAGGAALLGGPDAVISKAGFNATLTAGGVTVTQRSNSFTALMPGVDVTLSAAAQGQTATLNVSDNGSGRAGALNTFVSQINQVIDSIAGLTSYGTIKAGTAAASAGALAGDSTIRSIADRLVSTIFPGGGETLATFGLDVNRDGHLTFDQAKFQTAYQTDPQGVQDAFIGSTGFTSRVSAVAALASDRYTGFLTQAITSDKKAISNLNDEIASWDDRLATKQASLTQQYSKLETTLSRLQSQSSWLTTQLNAMNPSKD